jgi:hypothetical protein
LIHQFTEDQIQIHDPIRRVARGRVAGRWLTWNVECEVIESRPSNRPAGRALVRTRNKVVKQDGTVVLTFTPLRMVKCGNTGTSGQ